MDFFQIHQETHAFIIECEESEGAEVKEGKKSRKLVSLKQMVKYGKFELKVK